MTSFRSEIKRLWVQNLPEKSHWQKASARRNTFESRFLPALTAREILCCPVDKGRFATWAVRDGDVYEFWRGIPYSDTGLSSLNEISLISSSECSWTKEKFSLLCELSENAKARIAANTSMMNLLFIISAKITEFRHIANIMLKKSGAYPPT